MNKTLVIAGGTAVVSLAVGAIGGYFYAKKRFDEEVDRAIEEVSRDIRKTYSLRLMQLQAGKPGSPKDIPSKKVEEADEEEPELSEQDEQAVARTQEAKRALTDYRGYSPRPGGSGEIVENNIFAADKAKKTLPPRGPGGKFVARHSVSQPEETPYIITQEEFLDNEPENDQENIKYFAEDNTLIDSDKQEVDIELVGEVNLTLFPETEDGSPSILCVRNEARGIDYEIQLMDGSLTEYMGFMEESDEYAGQD